MATMIATPTAKDNGTLEGICATIRVNAPIAIVPNSTKASEEAPDFRIARQTGEEYLFVKLEAPEIGVIFGNVAPAPGGDSTRKVILWNNPN